MKKYPSILVAAFGTLTVFSLVLTMSCKKPKPSCYSAALEKEYKDKYCTMDCPGVIGCDGKTYCNECEAAKQGISVANYEICTIQPH